MKQLPLVYACFRDPCMIESIFKHKAILSKKELLKRGIVFHQNTSNRDVEKILKTEDDVTLYIDILFQAQFMYGGPRGPRFLFDNNLLYKGGVFILPTDQKAYVKDNGEVLYEQFERDKHFSREAKDTLIERCIKSDVHILPEVHIPKQVEFRWLRGVLVNPVDYKEYTQRKELEDIVIIEVQKPKEESRGSIPDAICFQEAYQSYLKRRDFEN